MNPYTSENALTNNKDKCGDDNICTFRVSRESHIQWNKHFHKSLLLFRIYAASESDNEIDNSSIGNKTTINFKQNPVFNGYHIISELEDLLKSGYYESL